MVMYLQTCRTMSVCYSYISVAMSSALRMGLHRSDVSKDLSLVEVEVRKRAFWVLRTMDTYVATLLGLPRTISDEDVNQQMPLEIDDELIMDNEILPMPAGHISIIAATNAHTSLIMILAKIVKYIYSAPNDVNGNSGLCRVDYSRVLELEGDLEGWYQHLTALSTSTSFGVTRYGHRESINARLLTLYQGTIGFEGSILPCSNGAVPAISTPCHSASLGLCTRHEVVCLRLSLHQSCQTGD